MIMKQKKENRSTAIRVNVTPSELARLKMLFKETTFHVFSDFIRSLLKRDPIIKKVRNQSLDDILIKLAGIKNDLELVRCNFTAGLDRFYSLPPGPLQKEALELLLAAAFDVQQGIESARIAIFKIYEQCSQN
jgi:hypothetical protein